jgi:hypothetical protein
MKACPGCAQQVLPGIALLTAALLPAVTWQYWHEPGNYRQSPSGRRHPRVSVR